jgi:transcriptional regulator with GAF, ATPase, and Fis domain
MILAQGPTLVPTVPQLRSQSSKVGSERLVDVQREHIMTVVSSSGWRIRGKYGAAERLGLKPTTLETQMRRLGIKRPQSRSAPISFDGGARHG